MAARKYIDFKKKKENTLTSELSSSPSLSSSVFPTILLQALTMTTFSAPPPSHSGQASHSGRDEDLKKITVAPSSLASPAHSGRDEDVKKSTDARPSPPASPGSTKSSSSSSSSLFVNNVPSVLSPLPTTPLRNQPLSDKCEKIKLARRKSFLPPKSCSYLFKKGGKKGEQCTRPCLLNEILCGLHMKIKDKSNTSHCAKQTAETLYTTRINRLHRFQKYFFVKLIKHTTVILRCKDKKYILRLPKGMINPEFPTERHYLIRDSNGTVVWKKDKI